MIDGGRLHEYIYYLKLLSTDMGQFFNTSHSHPSTSFLMTRTTVTHPEPVHPGPDRKEDYVGGEAPGAVPARVHQRANLREEG